MAAPLTLLPYDEDASGPARRPAAPARLLDLAIRAMNHCTGPHKDQAFADLAAGNVVELGAGGGSNLPWLPAGTRLYAVEPNRALHASLRARCDRAGIEAVVLPVSAERLPLPDACVDEVICSLALCTIPDAEAALAEVARVLRPSGQFRFVEHVAAPAGSLRGRAQGALRRPWGAIAGGCDPHRDTLARIEAVGFAEVHAVRGLLRHSPAWPVNTAVWGWAVR
ncbi:class I SAM-dependent methyltransferase [Brachybacterium hainanense]|uniref:Class I SAM-dependent methyltransferase n=1 Tax=Brachybacterium hainanense TaxID=1541174 RepID=A0ABV6REZ7_9MICO